MPVNVGNLVPASLKSKEVATQEYVDNGILNSGYVTPEGVQEAIVNDTTIIDGSRIVTGSLSAADIRSGVLVLSDLGSFTPLANFTGTVGDGDGIRVYENGALKVKLGQL